MDCWNVRSTGFARLRIDAGHAECFEQVKEENGEHAITCSISQSSQNIAILGSKVALVTSP